MTTKEKIPSKPVLGKGLASLLSPSTAAAPAPTPAAAATPATTNAQIPAQGAEADPTPNKDRQMGIAMANIDDIVPNAYQPRQQFDDATIEELSQSIKENGLIQPLLVRRGQKGYQLIAGERRWRAAKLAGLKQVPIVVRRSTDREALELAIIENIQREDLNCIDTALAYNQLALEFDLKQEEISTRVGKDRATVANYLRLLKLPAQVQGWLKQSTLSFGHGKALAGLDDPKLIELFAGNAVDHKWSVRELENQIQKHRMNQEAKASGEQTGSEPSPLELRFKNIGKDLSQKYSTKVAVKGHEKKGKIVIEYHSGDDLNRILDQLYR